jgi:hypothetical protein
MYTSELTIDLVFKKEWNGIFYINKYCTTNFQNILLEIYAPVKVNPSPTPDHEGIWWGFCHRILSQPYWEFVGFVILPIYTGRIVGIVAGHFVHFVQWKPWILPFYNMWQRSRKWNWEVFYKYIHSFSIYMLIYFYYQEIICSHDLQFPPVGGAFFVFC